MTETVQLPERLDLSTVGPLADTLRARMGAALALDASGVNHLGGLGAQVLLSAVATWAATGQSLTVVDASDAFREQAAELGLSQDDLQVGEVPHVD